MRTSKGAVKSAPLGREGSAKETFELRLEVLAGVSQVTVVG